jgi:hypothetical protein
VFLNPWSASAVRTGPALVITGSISAHRSPVKSLRYRLRSFTGLSKHSQTRRPAVTLQIHLITI